MIFAALVLASATGESTCDHMRLSRMPTQYHPAWCKVLNHCPLVGGGLLSTAVNCTTENTVHTARPVAPAVPGLTQAQQDALNTVNQQIQHAQHVMQPGVRRAAPTEAEKMCSQPTCMIAIENLYDMALNSQDWRTAVTTFQLDQASRYMGGRRLSSTPRVAPPISATQLANLAAANPRAKFNPFGAAADPELVEAVKGLKNAAQAQLDACMHRAGVQESQLGLPVSIERMTGGGHFFGITQLRESQCYTMYQWMMTRLTYYTGVEYAKRRYHEGTNWGLIIAIIIASVNLVCCVGFWGGLVLCIRRRACYFAAKEVCPCCVNCLVECGCGPPDAERLNNEMIAKDGPDMGAVQPPPEVEMTRTAE